MIEIDFLWVGEETKTGDAITCRFTDPSTGDLAVLVIDGGFTDTGARIVDHITNYYATDVVDLVVCTHPDDDHIRGLFTVLQDMNVRRLLIHRPGQFGFTGNEHKSDLVEGLVKTAQENGTIVESGFAGSTYFGGALVVAGPSESNYRTFLSEQDEWDSLARQALRKLSEVTKSFAHSIRNLIADPGETLTDDNGGTSPRNNTSIICDLQVDGFRALFTGDAGAPALTAAANHLDSVGRANRAPDFFDVPHHGSRHNLTKELCDHLLGTPVPEGASTKSAFVSVGKKAADHPRPEVANAVKRRGYTVIPTRGINIWWNRGAPNRLAYGPIEGLGWLDESE